MVERTLPTVPRYVPAGREGGCMCSDTNNKRVYLLLGSNSWESTIERDHVDIFNIETREWSKRKCTGDIPRVQAGTAPTVINDSLYCFGGWFYGVNNDMHKLNLNTFHWSKILPANNLNEPLAKNKHGMVSYGNRMLLIFGGYGRLKIGSKYQAGADYDSEEGIIGSDMLWTNELHLFHIHKRVWVVPEMIGTRPKPCAAFSFHYIDRHRVLLFGGRQKQERVNELHILDVATWHWSGLILQDPVPAKRSFHTCCCLFNPDLIFISDRDAKAKKLDWLPDDVPDLSPIVSDKLLKEQHVLLLWGNDNDGEVLNDSWILHIEGNNIKWSQLYLPEWVNPRTWHTTDSLYNCDTNETIVLTIGGSVNNIFTNAEEDIITVSEPVVIKFGCPTLYTLCQKQVVSIFSDLDAIKVNLPFHVFKDLVTIKNVEKNVPSLNCSNRT